MPETATHVPQQIREIAEKAGLVAAKPDPAAEAVGDSTPAPQAADDGRPEWVSADEWKGSIEATLKAKMEGEKPSGKDGEPAAETKEGEAKSDVVDARKKGPFSDEAMERYGAEIRSVGDFTKESRAELEKLVPTHALDFVRDLLKETSAQTYRANAFAAAAELGGPEQFNAAIKVIEGMPVEIQTAIASGLYSRDPEDLKKSVGLLRKLYETEGSLPARVRHGTSGSKAGAKKFASDEERAAWQNNPLRFQDSPEGKLFRRTLDERMKASGFDA